MQSEAAQSGGDAVLGRSASTAGRALRTGHLVRSVQGRDQGRLYVVIKKGKDGFIYVADGAQRTVTRPKRKNPKHLLRLNVMAEGIAKALIDGKRVTDAEVRETLLQIIRSQELNGEEVDDTGKARCD